jgi:hypothetical protein
MILFACGVFACYIQECLFACYPIFWNGNKSIDKNRH